MVYLFRQHREVLKNKGVLKERLFCFRGIKTSFLVAMLLEGASFFLDMPKGVDNAMDYRTLHAKLAPILNKIARGYNGQCRFVDTDDLYQEMCLYLWINFKDGLPDNLNYSYVIRGCRFHILNYLRKNREKAKIFGLEDPLNEEQNTLKDILPQQDEGLDRCVERKIIFKEIMDNGYTKREKEVLALLLEGLTVREAGERLGISHVMVVKLKKRLIEKSRRKFRGYQKG